jgi:hypothetical protein
MQVSYKARISIHSNPINFNTFKLYCPLSHASLCSRSGAALDDVHVGEGTHEDSLLHGDDVVVVTRKGDKIKGPR